MHIPLGSLTLASEMDEMLYQPVAEHFQTLEDLDLDSKLLHAHRLPGRSLAQDPHSMWVFRPPPLLGTLEYLRPGPHNLGALYGTSRGHAVGG